MQITISNLTLYFNKNEQYLFNNETGEILAEMQVERVVDIWYKGHQARAFVSEFDGLKMGWLMYKGRWYGCDLDTMKVQNLGSMLR